MSFLDHNNTTRDVPSYYKPNALLSGIQIDGYDLPFTVQVIFPFTPSFSTSQVLLVKPVGDPNALKLPPKFILKVYDPRFSSKRFKAEKPWSYAAETEAASLRPAAGRNPEFECNIPETDDAASWEEFFYQVSEKQFYYERSAYIRLVSLQGTFIPRYFGSGALQLKGRAISPRLVMLEYIPDAQRLDAVDPNSVTLSAARSLIDAAHKIEALGVSHRDYNLGNIVFSHGKGMIIDFGACFVRENQSDEEWVRFTGFDGNVWNMKRRMRTLLRKSDNADPTLLDDL